jgi:uncharacterized membrane protein YccC
MTSLRIPRDLTPGEHAALAAATKMGELEQEARVLRAQLQQLADEKINAELRASLKLLEVLEQVRQYDQVRQQFEDMRAQVDRIANWMQGRDVTTREFNDLVQRVDDLSYNTPV